LTVSSFDKDFPAVVQRSRTIASDMSKGVQFLMKNKIDVIIGVGKLKPGKKRMLLTKTIKLQNTADHIIIATGARSRELLTYKMVKSNGYKAKHFTYNQNR
jgi:dihydrolipoamide dehydrogenase